ncbi:MAG: molybdopterin-dependent oxidoreductase [Gudongella sp.]|nr:molybdopterin-dependent oxidoreductase [Gudongella sp.]
MEDSTIKYIKTACTLDCWDSCSIIAQVKHGEIIFLKGDPRNPVTGGFLCEKGYNHLKMRKYPERLLKPLIKENGEFRQASWDEALDKVAEKLDELRKMGQTTALLYISEFGNSGVLKKADQRFFNAFGGVTMPIGSLCAGAGNEAQRYDFGKALSHEPSDYINSKVIIIWGRNPVATGPHLIPAIKTARENGTKIITIDPLETETTKISDQHIAPNPGSDGVLALVMANWIIQNGYVDKEYINKNTFGYTEFADSVSGFSLEIGEELTGVPKEIIKELAYSYAHLKPSAIILGFGIQRYSNGGDTVRAIDALGALTGNIGRSGGGVSYNNSVSEGLIDTEYLTGKSLAKQTRTYKRPLLADFILTENDPSVKMIYTARANPINQSMDTKKLLRAFKKVDFKVTLDMFLNDTAQLSDVVLPVKHFLEEDNIVMPPTNHSYINYCNKALEAPEGVLSELEILTELAKRLNLSDFPIMNSEKWLEKILRPMNEDFNIKMDKLKDQPIKVPGILEIPWSDGVFKTPSGKYEFYSKLAESEGFSPIAQYSSIKAKPSNDYPFYLITPHLRGSLHSQHFVLRGEDHKPTIYINPQSAKDLGLNDKDNVKISTETGFINAILEFDEKMLSDRVKIYEGGWLKRNGGINRLIPEIYSEMGMHAAYYEVVCKVEKIDI